MGVVKADIERYWARADFSGQGVNLEGTYFIISLCTSTFSTFLRPSTTLFTFPQHPGYLDVIIRCYYFIVVLFVVFLCVESYPMVNYNPWPSDTQQLLLSRLN